MMEAKQLITAFPTLKREKPIDRTFLRVSEFFYDSIQGEGINLGYPSAFLRLQGCSLNCGWCDTTEVWREGNPYTIEELLDMISKSDLVTRLRLGQHLVITGGSPLLQQEALYEFFVAFDEAFDFIPYVEVENECVIQPYMKIEQWVQCWNNSPKLTSSGVSIYKRYHSIVIKHTAGLANSWFKFVISQPEDWEEISGLFLRPGLIKREQIILMPEGATKAEIQKNADMVVEMAIRERVLYRSREHINLWGRKTGI